LVSATTSGIHAGAAVAHTRPGRPMPGLKVVLRLIAWNSGNRNAEALQFSVQRRLFVSRSTVHSPPCSQPSDSQMACRIRDAASSIDVASSRARATTYSAVSRSPEPLELTARPSDATGVGSRPDWAHGADSSQIDLRLCEQSVPIFARSATGERPQENGRITRRPLQAARQD
jgi:hypothetical protein